MALQRLKSTLDFTLRSKVDYFYGFQKWVQLILLLKALNYVFI